MPSRTPTRPTAHRLRQSLPSSPEPWTAIRPEAPPPLILDAINDATDPIRQPTADAMALGDTRVPIDRHLDAEERRAFGM